MKSSDHDLIISDFILPKVFIVLFLLIDDIFRTGGYLIGFTKPRKISSRKEEIPKLVGLGLSGVLSAFSLMELPLENTAIK
jgi:hypothetical protein